jgi:hypothetical protein
VGLLAPKLYHIILAPVKNYFIGVCPYVVFLHSWIFGDFLAIIDTSQQGKSKMAKITKVSIYDMDGTIVDSLHRYRTIVDDNGERIDLGYWRENEYRAMDDTLLPLAQQYKEDLRNENCFVIIATARVLRAADNEFIAKVLGEPDYIISRMDGDTISGGKLKIAGLAKFFNLKNFKDAEFTFYEDNVQYLKAVCDRFNIRGVYVPSKQGH